MKCEHCGYDDHGTGSAHACTKFNPQGFIVAPLGTVMSAQIQMEKDAARYRWLCEKFGQTYFPAALERLLSGREGGMYIADGKASMDAAIDAAMQVER